MCGCRTADPDPVETINITVGSLPLYHQQVDTFRSDLSGAAYIPAQGVVILADDGGKPSDVVPAYVADVRNDFAISEVSDAVNGAHGDLEGATFDGTYVYVISSLPGATEFAEDRFRAFSRYKFNAGVISEVETVSPRSVLMPAIETAFGSDFYSRIETLDSKVGGLNVEGLSATGNANELMIGLRSPHFGADFPQNTKSGEAIVLQANFTDFAPSSWQIQAHTIDLGGHGVRSMEWSPTAQGYFILAGIVEAGFDYAFYFWPGPGSPTVRIELDEFLPLCRPEAVTEIDVDGVPTLWVMSEESGAICDDVAYNYLLIELNDAFMQTLQ